MRPLLVTSGLNSQDDEVEILILILQWVKSEGYVDLLYCLWFILWHQKKMGGENANLAALQLHKTQTNCPLEKQRHAVCRKLWPSPCFKTVFTLDLDHRRQHLCMCWCHGLFRNCPPFACVCCDSVYLKSGTFVISPEACFLSQNLLKVRNKSCFPTV